MILGSIPGHSKLLPKSIIITRLSWVFKDNKPRMVEGDPLKGIPYGKLVWVCTYEFFITNTQLYWVE